MIWKLMIAACCDEMQINQRPSPHRAKQRAAEGGVAVYLVSKPARSSRVSISMQCDPGCTSRCWDSCNYDCMPTCSGTATITVKPEA